MEANLSDIGTSVKAVQDLPIISASSSVDVIWLKKDIRMHDHGPLSLIARSCHRPCIILYLYEPDQLCEKTVHGSHIEFINEGLIDLDRKLSAENCTESNQIDIYLHQFQCITACYAGAVFTFQNIHKQCPIHQLLCHMETGHLKSYARDKAVRRWCRSNSVQIKEFNQSGVTRGLSNRDDFHTNFKKFIDQPLWETPTHQQIKEIRRSLSITKNIINMLCLCHSPLKPSDIHQIPIEHRKDRTNRQYGGETHALHMLDSFLHQRGAKYSSGISSPNTSWTSCSRLSPYLTFGNVSLRKVITAAQRKQTELRTLEMKNSLVKPSPWLRSIASFLSRMHWRSHFIQKLESQPSLEKQDQCLAFSHLRRQPGDFCQEHYDAWSKGETGYPFVDACMRCLINCGWINFRMRAMLVSFATYNLWLDWKFIAPHLARIFLDYEPGIHYPQLQMQAGTTGINAMRVYNVTKQGKDQDPDGVFIRRFVPELQNVSNQYIHEPYKMPSSEQEKCGVFVRKHKSKTCPPESGHIVPNALYTGGINYPYPIVNEMLSAKTAKDKLSAVRKEQSTKEEAEKVYLRHGSRRFRNADRDGVKPKALNSSVKRVKINHGQKTILNSWKTLAQQTTNMEKVEEKRNTSNNSDDCNHGICTSAATVSIQGNLTPKKDFLITSFFSEKKGSHQRSSREREWNCLRCTFLNEKPFALVCSVCGSTRESFSD